jgi:peptidylprolyl isomerase
MRDILISTTVCMACLLLALISQLVAPSSVVASAALQPDGAISAAASRAAPAATAASASADSLELDPDDPNPTLFTMAPDSNSSTASASDSSDQILAQAAGASGLGGELSAPKERITPSGLRITDLVIGDGAEAVSGQPVLVNYRGTLANGIEFDSSYSRNQPFSFPLGAGRVIQGWDEGVAGMKVGGKRKLVIPPDLAYGERGAGGVIPPNATLTFEVELLRVGG